MGTLVDELNMKQKHEYERDKSLVFSDTIFYVEGCVIKTYDFYFI